MLDLFKKDWKTSVIGLISIVLSGLVIEGHIAPEFAGAIGLVANGILGLFSKDA